MTFKEYLKSLTGNYIIFLYYNINEPVLEVDTVEYLSRWSNYLNNIVVDVSPYKQDGMIYVYIKKEN